MLRSSLRKASLFAWTVMLLSKLSFCAHPQLLLDPTELEFIRAKAISQSSDWQELKKSCDDLATYSVQWPDAISGGTSPVRGYVSGTAHSAGVVRTGYDGNQFEAVITQLGVCYQALKLSNPGTAKKYAAQAHHIVTAIAQPPLTLTRQSDGVVRFAESLDAHGNDLRTGQPLTVFLPYNTISAGDTTKSVAVGETWSIAGAKGCTSMNGTWRVSAKSGNTLSFTKVDGTAAPPMNADCTLFTFNVMRDTGHPFRFWIPALAKAYDWFYEELTPTERQDLVQCMNRWLYEMVIVGLHSRHPEENYAFGNFWALVAAHVATDGDNAVWTNFYTSYIAERFNQIRSYRQRWMAGGGFGEGWQAYGYTATRCMMDAFLATKLHGTDWTQPPASFPFVDETLRYWMQFTTPSKLSLDDNEYVFPVGTNDKNVSEPVWIPLSHAVMFTAAERTFESRYAQQFEAWYREVSRKIRAAAGKNLPSWNSGVYNSRPSLADSVLYDDPSVPAADWKTLPLMYRAWSGNYAVTRSDWSDDAVEVTLLGGPSVGTAGNGKTQFNSGSITVQRGNDRLLVYGLGEAARSADIITADIFERLHGERSTYGNKKNSVFWAGANEFETRNQGLTSHTPPPGQDSSVTNWPSSIDRAEDANAYTYWRASGLESNNARSSVDNQYHHIGWTREVFFLRPKLIVVHDRTSVLNNSDDRTMFWAFGRNIAQMSTNSGLTRYDASFRGRFHGSFTSVLPTNASASVVDHDGLHFLYRIELRPSAMDHRSDNWLAVLDAADSPQHVSSITPLVARNADAVQFDDAHKTVVAFANASPPALPIKIPAAGTLQVYVAGLDSKAAYCSADSGSSITITQNCSRGQVLSSAGGVLTIRR